jgi:hypothetical protein
MIDGDTQHEVELVGRQRQRLELPVRIQAVDRLSGDAADIQHVLGRVVGDSFRNEKPIVRQRGHHVACDHAWQLAREPGPQLLEPAIGLKALEHVVGRQEAVAVRHRLFERLQRARRISRTGAHDGQKIREHGFGGIGGNGLLECGNGRRGGRRSLREPARREQRDRKPLRRAPGSANPIATAC